MGLEVRTTLGRASGRTPAVCAACLLVYLPATTPSAGSATARVPKPVIRTMGVYDETQDGLQTGSDPRIGTLSIAQQRPARLFLSLSVRGLPPRCLLGLELVRDARWANGGLTSTAHVGRIPRLGYTHVVDRLRTDRLGRAIVQISIATRIRHAGERVRRTYAHFDLEPLSACRTRAGPRIRTNELAAAPDPRLHRPFSFLE